MFLQDSTLVGSMALIDGYKNRHFSYNRFLLNPGCCCLCPVCRLDLFTLTLRASAPVDISSVAALQYPPVSGFFFQRPISFYHSNLNYNLLPVHLHLHEIQYEARVYLKNTAPKRYKPRQILKTLHMQYNKGIFW